MLRTISIIYILITLFSIKLESSDIGLKSDKEISEQPTAKIIFKYNDIFSSIVLSEYQANIYRQIYHKNFDSLKKIEKLNLNHRHSREIIIPLTNHSHDFLQIKVRPLKEFPTYDLSLDIIQTICPGYTYTISFYCPTKIESHKVPPNKFKKNPAPSFINAIKPTAAARTLSVTSFSEATDLINWHQIAYFIEEKKD